MASLIESLNNALRAEQVLTEKIDILPYGFDGTAALKQLPAAVVFPESAEEVQAVVRICQEWKTPIVTRGSGTGLSGGSVPLAGSVVLCLVKLNRILKIDSANLTIMVEPGVITKDIGEAVSEYGLFYPPDPSSMKISTIGGNVANNSGGLRGLKYGVTRDYVMGMEVITASGDRIWLGNACVKDVAGYSLKDLFIGSEGTLGIITKVLLKLVPKPAAKKTLLASYDTLEGAAETVSAIIAANIIPCTLEFLDKMTIQCVEDFAHVGLPQEAASILLMETDGHPSVVEEEAAAMERIAREKGALKIEVAADALEAERLATARRSAFAAVARIRPTTILEDTTVPRSELANMVRFCQATADKYQLKIANFGHMGDGNLHPTFLTNEKDAEEMERVEQAMAEIFKYTIDVGGTITGEHGIGLAKKAFLPQQFADASYDLLATIKQAMDPHGLLNPGKIFDLPQPPAQS